MNYESEHHKFHFTRKDRTLVTQTLSNVTTTTAVTKTNIYKQVKNRAPAPVQITAEQLLREATERQGDDGYNPPEQKITNADELADFQMRKRSLRIDSIRVNRPERGYDTQSGKNHRVNLQEQDRYMSVYSMWSTTIPRYGDDTLRWRSDRSSSIALETFSIEP